MIQAKGKNCPLEESAEKNFVEEKSQLHINCGIVAYPNFHELHEPDHAVCRERNDKKHDMD